MYTRLLTCICSVHSQFARMCGAIFVCVLFVSLSCNAGQPVKKDQRKSDFSTKIGGKREGSPSVESKPKILQPDVLPTQKQERALFKQVTNPSLNCIRVLLQSWAHSRPIYLSSPKGFIALDGATKKKSLLSCEVVVQLTPRGYALNRVQFGPDVLLLPRSGRVIVGPHTYEGIIHLAKEGPNALLVNMLDLEAYICSVVRTESWPGWPLEVNKAFAIMCRTYAIAMLRKARKQKKWYDLKNTNEHQTYRGIHDSLVIKEAVKQTRGTFMTYKNEPILAMFDSCCGGVVPAHIKGFNFSKAPYLARSYACTFCKKCSLYSWKVEYPFSEFERLIGPICGFESGFYDARVVKKDGAGLVQELKISWRRRCHAISGKQLYSLCKEVKSYCFTAQAKDKKVLLQGRGFGHHVGLCQWGARQMVREGWNYRGILNFYYPHISFARLST